MNEFTVFRVIHDGYAVGAHCNCCWIGGGAIANEEFHSNPGRLDCKLVVATCVNTRIGNSRLLSIFFPKMLGRWREFTVRVADLNSSDEKELTV